MVERDRSDEEFIERIARPLRDAETVGASFDARVMAAVRAAATERVPVRPRPLQAWQWLVRPRTVRLSPAAGLALAAGIAGLAVLGARAGRSPAVVIPSDHVTAAASYPRQRHTAQPVQFVLVAPNASRVTLVGDFNDWDAAATPLRSTSAGGLWTVTVPLAPGRHQYAFVVDGARWVTDPSAPTAVEDDFGTHNSVVTVGERGT